MINTAIASYGMSGMVFHGPLLLTNNNFFVCTIFERTSVRSKMHFPNARIVRDYNEIINDSSIELVIINTPDHLHFEMAKKALQKGKHVVIEKPFTQTSDQAKELIDLSIKKNKTLSVFQNRRWDSDFLTVQKVLNENKLGRVVEFESHFDRFRNYLQDSWKEKKMTGTGNVYNLGPHLIDQALMLWGIPEAVFADIRKMRTGIEVDDYFDINLYYSDVKVTLKSSYLVKKPGPRFVLNGDMGSFVKYGTDPQEEALKKGVLPNTMNWGKESNAIQGTLTYELNGETREELMVSEKGNYPVFYDNIYKAICFNEPLLVAPEQALTVIEIIEASYASSKIRKSMPINPF